MIDPADYSQEYTEHCAEIVEIQRLTAELAAARAEVERLRFLAKSAPIVPNDGWLASEWCELKEKILNPKGEA